METRRRSIAKAISYRFMGTIVTAFAAWLVTGEPGSAAMIASLDTIAKVGAYYAHERLWERIPFGRPKPPEYEI